MAAVGCSLCHYLIADWEQMKTLQTLGPNAHPSRGQMAMILKPYLTQAAVAGESSMGKKVNWPRIRIRRISS